MILTIIMSNMITLMIIMIVVIAILIIITLSAFLLFAVNFCLRVNRVKQFPFSWILFSISVTFISSVLIYLIYFTHFYLHTFSLSALFRDGD